VNPHISIEFFIYYLIQKVARNHSLDRKQFYPQTQAICSKVRRHQREMFLFCLKQIVKILKYSLNVLFLYLLFEIERFEKRMNPLKNDVILSKPSDTIKTLQPINKQVNGKHVLKFIYLIN